MAITKATGPGSAATSASSATTSAGPKTDSPGGEATALAAFAALAAADLYATAKSPRGPARAAKPLLMPALATYARRSTRPGRPPAALLAGLACATAGDTALLWDRHHRALLTGMAAFLGTQLSYTAGMTARLGAVRGLRARPKRAVAAFAAWGPSTRCSHLRWSAGCACRWPATASRSRPWVPRRSGWAARSPPVRCPSSPPTR
ncbi:lysoplasmalogenase family protein [Streptomyces smyrnaeus]|uniref:lysoplasmalogenase family protein n=1 Tax=Streptomyces smyrnaeus TaxID=1387713 RepID=UPI00369868D7